MKFLVVSVLMLSLVSISASAKAPLKAPPRAIQVGGNAQADACQEFGEVTDKTEVRLWSKGRWQSHTIEKGQEVFVCERTPESLGIVYSPGATSSTQTCNIAGGIPKRVDYAGPCKSGWIAADVFKAEIQD